MEINFNTKLAENYASSSQKARIMTESWVRKSIFCPNCGHLEVESYSNNKPVADFYCENCKEDYELKSKKKSIGTKIVDGAYSTMISRLQSANNPNLFILNYNLADYSVKNFFVIPKHFFVPTIIEKRKPLAQTARRAGWVGCNILLKNIPETGKIFYVRNGIAESKEQVLSDWQRTLFLRNEKSVLNKGWLLDIMQCIESIGKQNFNINDIYAFERKLSALHPDNSHVKDKIRQQLQILRDRGYLEFTSRGQYHLI